MSADTYLPRPSLKENFSWSFLGAATYAACQWGMLSVLSKFRSPAELGVFVYALALATPIYVLAQLQLRSIQATDVEHRFSFSTYLTLRVMCVAIASVVVLGILFSTHPDKITMLTCLFLAAARAAESMSDVFYGAMQQKEEMRAQAISLCLKGCLSLAFLVIGIMTLHNVAGAALGMLIAWTLLLAAYDIPRTARIFQGREPAIPPHRSPIHFALPLVELKPLLRDALPMGLVMFLLSLSVNIPRYFLKAETDMKTLGIFAALAYIQVAGMAVVSALGQAAAPKLARLYQFGDIDGFRQLLQRVVGVGVILGVLGVLCATVCGRVVLTLLYKAEYGTFHREFAVMSIGSGLAYVASFLGYAMTSMRRFRHQLFTIGISTLVLTAACFWLVPRYGLLGAAAASLLSTGVLAILNASIVFGGLEYDRTLVISAMPDAPNTLVAR